MDEYNDTFSKGKNQHQRYALLPRDISLCSQNLPLQHRWYSYEHRRLWIDNCICNFEFFKVMRLIYLTLDKYLYIL